MSKISDHIDTLARIFDDACSKSFVNLPRLVMTLNYLSREMIGANIDFYQAKHGYTIFSIKETTFRLVYPPTDKCVKIMCRHREAYEWRSELILTAKNTKVLIKFIMDAVNNPPHPING